MTRAFGLARVTALATILGRQHEIAVPSATVTLCDVGTTTPITDTIYAGPTGATTLSNPLTMDATGSRQFYVDRPRYVDLVRSAPGYAFTVETMPIGEPSTVAPWLDITDKGATGDGTTNDTAAFTTAIIASTNEVLAPEGTFLFSPTTLTRNHLRYRGVHGVTTFKLAGQGGGAHVSLLSMGVSDVLFEDIIFDGNKGTILAGSGNYWNGLIALAAGAYQITFRRCVFQNTARSAVYGLGSGGSQIAGVIFDDCRFTGIGLAGSGNGGAAVMLEQNIHDCELRHNRFYGTNSSNFFKGKGDSTTSRGIAAIDNFVDYSTCTTFDAANTALGIELWNGCYDSVVSLNRVIGPDVVPAAGACWGISLGDARGSTVSGNRVLGGASNQAMAYGIEMGECPGVTLTGNTVKNVVVGTNATNNNPVASHAQTIVGNVYDNCYTNGITTDSGPAGIKIEGNSFVDCGTEYILLNSTGAITRTCKILGNTFRIRDQVRLAAAGAIFGVYVVGTGRSDYTPVEIAHNDFGPYPGGSSTRGLLSIGVNNPQGIRIIDNDFDGARPDTGAAGGDRAINGDCYGLTVRGNRARNFVTEFAYADTDQINVFENNDIGSLTIQHPTTAAAGANAGTSPPAPVVASGVAPRGGSLTFGTGTGPAAGAQVVVTFHMRMLTTPFITLTPLNGAAAALGAPYATSVTNAGFTINFPNAPAASQANTTYAVAWHALTP